MQKYIKKDSNGPDIKFCLTRQHCEKLNHYKKRKFKHRHKNTTITLRKFFYNFYTQDHIISEVDVQKQITLLQKNYYISYNIYKILNFIKVHVNNYNIFDLFNTLYYCLFTGGNFYMNWKWNRGNLIF